MINMSKYFSINGENIKDKSIQADETWDILDLYPKTTISMFIDSADAGNLTMEVGDPHSNFYEYKSVSVEEGMNVYHLEKNYPFVRFSIDTTTTLTAFYELGV